MSPAAIISELEARTNWAEQPGHRGQQRARLSRIEDYLFINGDRLSATRAAVPDEVIGRCGRWADDVHEPLTRARGGGIADPGNAVVPCRPCHDEVTFRPESELGWAYQAGLLRHSWDARKDGEVA